jgi:hypothetical protein
MHGFDANPGWHNHTVFERGTGTVVVVRAVVDGEVDFEEALDDDPEQALSTAVSATATAMAEIRALTVLPLPY